MKKLTKDLWVQVVTLIVVALGSASVGFFGVVGAFGSGGAAGSSAPDRRTSLAAPPSAEGPPTTASIDQEKRVVETTGSAPQPTGAKLVAGEPYYWRCWAEGQPEPSEEQSCGRIQAFERLMASQLNSVEDCARRYGRSGEKGTLSLAVEVVFPLATAPSEGSLSLWAGRSSTLSAAEDIVSCVRSQLKSLPLHGVPHEKHKYVIFFPLQLGADAEKAGQGSQVALIMDQVRLRSTPETGKIQALLRQGETLVLHELAHGWARVSTADGKNGWVIADAIKQRVQ